MDTLDQAKLLTLTDGLTKEDLEIFLSTDGKNTVHLRNATKIQQAINIFDFIKELYGTKQAQAVKEYGNGKPGVKVDTSDSSFCKIHEVKMTPKIGKYGKFYSHMVNGNWCNGK